MLACDQGDNVSEAFDTVNREILLQKNVLSWNQGNYYFWKLFDKSKTMRCDDVR